MDNIQQKSASSLELIRLVDSTIQHLKSENTRFSSKVDELENDFRVQKEKTLQLKHENTVLSSANKEFKFERQNAIADYHNMEKKLIGYSTEKSRLENVNEELTRDVEDLKTKIQALETSKSTLSKKNADISAQAQESENKYLDTFKELKNIQSKKAETDDARGKAEATVAELNKKIEKDDIVAKKLIDQNKNLLAEKQGLIQLKNNLVGENNSLTKMKFQAQQNLEKEIAERDHW